MTCCAEDQIPGHDRYRRSGSEDGEYPPACDDPGTDDPARHFLSYGIKLLGLQSREITLSSYHHVRNRTAGDGRYLPNRSIELKIH